MTPSPLCEITARLNAVRAGLQREHLDALIIESRPNTLYLSGFDGTASLLLITRRNAWLLVDFRYAERARREVQGLRVQFAKKPLNEALGALVKRVRAQSVGFEGSLSFDSVAAMRTALKPARLRRCAALKDIRAVKSAYEARQLRRAQAAAEKVFDGLLGELRPGMTERDVHRRILERIEDAGLEGPSFDPIVASGPNSSMPHARSGSRRLRRRDIITIDMGVRRAGYCSDMTRSVFFGPPTAEQRSIYDIVLAAQESGLAAIRAGARARDVDAAARKFIARHGHGKDFGHGLGHGVGVEIHEPPTLNARSQDVLKEGACVTVEPGIYLAGRFGVRIEDTVIVRPDGCENLVHVPKSPLIL